MAWPEEHEDTVLYGEREWIGDKNLTLRMIDGAKAEFFGEVELLSDVDITGDVSITGDLTVNGIPIPEPYNVKSYGAVGNGIVDDTAAIQATFNAASIDGGHVIIPAGVYKFSTLTIGGPIRITGTGGMMWAGASFGGATWNDMQYLSGTILKSTVTAGKAITTLAPTTCFGLSIEDLFILGPGTGTSIGLALGHTDYGNSVCRVRLSRVGVGNFSIGCWFGMENCQTDSLFVQGCLTGIQTKGVHNGNVHNGLNVQVCTNFGLKLENSYGNSFNGGVFQSNTGTCIAVDGSENQFLGIYFENAGATNAIHIGYSNAVSYGNGIIGCLFTVPTDKVLVAGHYNIVQGHSDHPVVFSGAVNTLIGTFFAFSDTSGGADTSLVFNNKGPVRLGGYDVRLASDTTFYLESVGTSSFIRRMAGNTEIGAPNGYGIRSLIGATEQFKVSDAGVTIPNALDHDGTTVGFYGTAPIAKPASVTAAQALVNLGLLTTPVAETIPPAAPLRRTIKAVTATTYAPILTDENLMVTLSNAATITVTMPSNATIAFPIGSEIEFLWYGVGQPVFAAGGGATIVSRSGFLKASIRYAKVTAKKLATNEWLLSGDLVA